MQKLTIKKKILIIAMAVVLIIVLVIVGINGLNAYGNSAYKNAPLSDKIEDFYQPDDFDVTNMLEINEDMEEDIISELEGNYEELSEKKQKWVDKANESIVKYFDEKYSVDVSEKINKLKAYKVDFDAIDHPEVGGYYNQYSDDATIYIDDYIIEDVFDFNETYIHEAVHYLGFVEDVNNEDEYSYYLYEGMTEAITFDICKTQNLDYTGDEAWLGTAYETATVTAMQLLEHSPDIAQKVVTDEGFILDDGVNDSFGGKDCALQVEFALFNIMNKTDENNARAALQALMGEHAKMHNDSEAPVYTDRFGLWWIFNG